MKKKNKILTLVSMLGLFALLLTFTFIPFKTKNTASASTQVGTTYYFGKTGTISYSGNDNASTLYSNYIRTAEEFESVIESVVISRSSNLFITTLSENLEVSVKSYSLVKSFTSYSLSFELDYFVTGNCGDPDFFDDINKVDIELSVKLVIGASYSTYSWDNDDSGFTFTMEDKYFNVNYYDYEGGTLLSSQSLQYYATPTAPTIPTRVGYTFNGWSSNVSNVTQDIDIYGTWSTQTFNVSYYDYEGGTLLKNEVVNYGASVSAPVDPTRLGFNFLGWSADTTNVTQDIVVYGLWDQIWFSCEFWDYEGGTLLTIQYGDIYTEISAPNDPDRYGYTYLGWSSEDYKCITDDLVIYGTWSINSYDVTFYDREDGLLLSKQTIEYCSSATAPTDPTRTGYVFNSWSTEDYKYVTQDLVVYGTWNIKQFKVNFYDYQGGTLINSTIYNYGSTIIYPNNPTRLAYEFLGWSETPVYCNKELNIYGTWELIQEYYDGYNNGYDKGFTDGYKEAQNLYDDGKVNANFASFMFAIFDAPFNVIRNIFDFEIFGIDLANFILTIISLILVFWVLRKLL